MRKQPTTDAKYYVLFKPYRLTFTFSQVGQSQANKLPQVPRYVNTIQKRVEQNAREGTNNDSKRRRIYDDFSFREEGLQPHWDDVRTLRRDGYHLDK